jgi:cytochrome P450
METQSSGVMDREIPGPMATPALGWLPWLLRFAFDPLGSLENLRRKYGDMIRLELDRYPVVVIFDPELNRQILRDPSVFYSYEADLIPLPLPPGSSIRGAMRGMPLMNGPRHDDHRKALLPYFHKKFVTRYHAGCVQVTQRKVASWKHGMELDLRVEMEQLAMWLATEPVLGLDPAREGEAIGRQLERTIGLVFNPLTFLLPYDLPGLPFHRLLKNGQKMESIVRAVIERKKAEGLAGDDILSAMMRMHEENPQRLSEEELIGHTTTMFRGGYNPSGMVLYWTIFLLSQHPDEWNKVLKEQDALVNGDIPTPQEVEHMPYLEGVLKETMRLFPAGTWTARLATQDFELASHCLPKGTWVILSPYVTHRIPELFPEPYSFLPERWLSIHPTAYEFMPFSAGPRYCIGTSLAMMQLKVVMSILLRRFRFTLTPGVRVDCVGMNAIRPRHGLPMILHRPDSSPAPVPVKGNVGNIVQLP